MWPPITENIYSKVENMVEKEKMLVTSIFSFTNHVPRPPPQKKKKKKKKNFLRVK